MFKLDKDQFDKHMFSVCRKENNQLNVMLRLKLHWQNCTGGFRPAAILIKGFLDLY